MSLKLKYAIFIGILHLVMVLLIYHVLNEQKWLFIASETLILLSLYLSYLLYLALIKPLDLMQSGTDAIADQDFSVKYLKTGSKEVDKLVDVFNTMIDSLRQERTYMSGQSYFIQNLLEVSPLGTIIMDMDGKLSNVNAAAQKMLKIPRDYQGKTLADYPSTLIDALIDLPLSAPEVISTNSIDKYKCRKAEVIHQGFKRQFILIDDLSTEILASEKAAFGRIIRMMAHEVNNSMGAVNSILDTVIEYGFADNKDPELKESLQIAMDRNSGLAKFMDNYASLLRLPSPAKQSTDLTILLKKCGQLFTPTGHKYDISIDYHFPPSPVIIQADPVLLEQAISNIIKNAIEAIEQDGDITISCHCSPTTVTITDNGQGLSTEAQQKIFTPFYSTKPAGQGVGLMLIREVLQSHDAQFSLTADSRAGLTTFLITFP